MVWEGFYETLEATIEKVPKRDEVILASDFNAKTGSGYNEFKDNMGHKLRKDIESCTDQQLRKEKLQQKKEIKKEVKKRIKEVHTEQLESRLAVIENTRNNSTRYFTSLKELKSNRKQNSIVVKDEQGKTAVTKNEQIDIITKYFKKMLAPESSKENYITYEPQAMREAFTVEEIQKAARKLKNGKSAGSDDIEFELIKYAPLEVFNQIANIDNL